MVYNQFEKLRENIAAVKVALDFRKGGQLLPGDQGILRGYSGFGGIKAILFPAADKQEWIDLHASKQDLRLYPSIMELHQLLRDKLGEQEYKETLESLKNSILTAFYTPDLVPKAIYSVLAESGFSPKKLYEPSAGAGVFIMEAIDSFPELQKVTAVEKDRLTGLVLTALGTTLEIPVQVQIRGLEDTPAIENGQADLLVSNMPFGNFQVFDADYPDKAISGKIHNYFFAKGLDKLAEGGLMAYVTTQAFLHSDDNRQVQEADELIPKLGALIEKSFEKEAELQQLKSSLSNLEREIALKIQEKQEQQQEQAGIKPDLDGPIAGEAIIVNMNGFEGKPETRTDKIVNGANAGSDQDNARIELKKNRGLKI